MAAFFQHLARYALILWFFGWISYPGWYSEWYTKSPEQYAFPASMSTAKDPHWGFWFW